MSIGVLSACKNAIKPILLTLLGGATVIGVDTALPSYARAQETSAESAIETVTVTARRRSENEEKVPVAVSVMNQEQLDQDQIRKDSDLTLVTPSLNVGYSYGGVMNGYSIRGLSQGQFSGPSVTLYFSEAPTQAPGGSPLYDLSSTQVLRGPQGTLFGRATTGGAIVFTPQHPDLDSFSGMFDATEGTLGTNILTGVVNVPLIDGELAIRIAARLDQRDGYTHVEGTDETLDGRNRSSFRIGAEWQPTSKFDNYVVLDANIVAESTGAQVTVGYNPSLLEFNLPSSTATPLGAVYGNAFFGGVCAADVANGYAPNVNSCENQRLGMLAGYGASIAAEVARYDQGGSSTVRTVPFNQTPYPPRDDAQTYMLVDNAKWELGDLGFSDITLKNNFSYSMYESQNCEYVAIPDHYIESCFGAISQNDAYASISQYYPRMGPFEKTLTEEFQIDGTYDNDLIVWLAGIYYSGTPTPNPLFNGSVGCNNLYRVFGGVFNPGYGFACANAVNVSWERGIYANAVWDFRWLVPGLHLTTGIRTTTDETSSTIGSYTPNYPSGLPSLTGVMEQPVLKSSGLGWNVALDDQVNDDLLLYVTSSRGYKPGGFNNSVGAAGAPSYTPTYSPESVIDVELGAKDKFQIDGIQGIFNANLYRNTYSNIQEPLVNSSGGLTFQYTENVAAAVLQGIELESIIVPSANWQINADYSLNDNFFTKYFAADPLGVAGPGSPECVASHSTATSCEIDLSGNPFPTSAKHQGSVTVRYAFWTAPQIGNFSVSVTGYAQSREYWTSDASRNIQVYGPVLGYANVQRMVSQPGYGLFNGRIDWGDMFGSGIDGSFWINNAFNMTYSTGAFVQLNSLGIDGKWFAPPRTLGIELRYKFGP
jgi:iron complex outermembrane receptor protein